jgi:hypothetical protein
VFISPLIVEALPVPGRWKTVAPLVWCDTTYGHLIVPVGFETDLASVPGVARVFPDFNPVGVSRRPAVMHDWLYTTKPVARDIADRFLRAALIAEGEAQTVANVYYDAVHLFGGSHWSSP